MTSAQTSLYELWLDQVPRTLELMHKAFSQATGTYLASLRQGASTADAMKALDGSSALASNPLATGMERTFGALADAFGLGPGRELATVWAELIAAATARQAAQAEYLLTVAEAWRKGTEQLMVDLAAMGRRGERAESMLALLRLWAKVVDAALHDAMQSEQGLQATARVVRAATRQRQQLQRVAGLVGDCLHIATRADVDEAYREIQELKRELRKLKKSAPAAARSSKTREPSA